LIRKFGEPVLDVGCGTGRLLLPWLVDGVDVDGVDISPAMLRECRRRARSLGLRPRLRLQSMEALNMRSRYRTIVVPSSSFQLLTSEASARLAMAAFRRHLEPGGALVMPFIVLTAGESEVRERRLPDGSMVRRRYESWFDRKTRLERTLTVFEIIVGAKVVATETHRRNPATRAYTVNQAVEMYEGVGITVEKVVSGFKSRRFREGDTVFTLIGRT
jgi:cyclopropane fatty-acyl-phospholipid synthase-like methyltransferase